MLLELYIDQPPLVFVFGRRRELRIVQVLDLLVDRKRNPVFDPLLIISRFKRKNIPLILISGI